jgi:hypothetical protein
MTDSTVHNQTAKEFIETLRNNELLNLNRSKDQALILILSQLIEYERESVLRAYKFTEELYKLKKETV